MSLLTRLCLPRTCGTPELHKPDKWCITVLYGELRSFMDNYWQFSRNWLSVRPRESASEHLRHPDTEDPSWDIPTPEDPSWDIPTPEDPSHWSTLLPSETTVDASYRPSDARGWSAARWTGTPRNRVGTHARQGMWRYPGVLWCMADTWIHGRGSPCTPLSCHHRLVTEEA